MYSQSIEKLISAFKKLPSVGQHTAERHVMYLLKTGKKPVTELMLALKELVENVKSCATCWNFGDTSPCAICKDMRRDHTTICVVADVPDLVAIEKTSEYRGVYHVLRGLLDPGDEDSLKHIKLKELLQRTHLIGGQAKNKNQKINEIILALNPDLPGETTMLYLEKEFKKTNLTFKVSRLARGLPMGSDLQYADEITLASAIKNRLVK